jgi:hypothetical protein
MVAVVAATSTEVPPLSGRLTALISVTTAGPMSVVTDRLIGGSTLLLPVTVASWQAGDSVGVIVRHRRTQVTFGAWLEVTVESGETSRSAAVVVL